MLEPISKQKKALIVNSVKRVFKNNDIKYLSKTAYNYLYLASGFIAHYNHYGFMAEYEEVCKLAEDIARNESMNMWDNFREGEKGYEYYMSKADVYRELVKVAKKYLVYA